MKNLKKLFAIILSIIVLTGCGMKEKINMEIKSDKKLSFEISILMDNDMIDTLISINNNSEDIEDLDDIEDIQKNTKTYTDKERWDFLEETSSCDDVADEQFKCEKIEDGNYKGYKLVIDNADIDTVTGTGEKVNLSEFDEAMGNSLFTKNGDVYVSNFEFSGFDSEYSDYSSQLDMFVATFEVKLPNPSISNNADKVSSDGLTLTWDLSKSNNKSIDFSFKFDPNSKVVTSNTGDNGTNDSLISGNTNTTGSKKMSTTTLILIIACGVLGLLVIILIIVLIARKPKKVYIDPVSVQPEPIPNTPVKETKVEETSTEEKK